MDNFLTVDCRERLNQLNDLICVFRPSICGFSVTFFKLKKKTIPNNLDFKKDEKNI
jgi:hypothetical protein